jgi:ABC-type polysaccharide/polyol phosphate export permease
MKEMINELIQYRELLYMMTLRDIKVRYKQSVMGFMWAIFMPMLIVAAGILVKKAFSFVSGKPMEFSEISSVAVKALPWSFFVGSLRFATNSLITNTNLVTKIYFPREVFPLSATFANLFDFFIASIALTVILAIMGVGISIYIIWLPFLMILLIMFTAGVGMLFACANLFFRDVKYIVEVILTFAIFFTPVFYEASMFGKWSPLLLINPVGAILEGINDVVVFHRAPDMFWLGYSAISSITTLIFSWWIFHKAEFTFAENI